MLDLLFFFNDTATTEIYTLSLHDALPICERDRPRQSLPGFQVHHRELGVLLLGVGIRLGSDLGHAYHGLLVTRRSEEHTSELQSQSNLVCRLLLEKKNNPRPLTKHCMHSC